MANQGQQDANKKRSSIEVAIRVRPMRGELNESKVAWDVGPTTLKERSNADSLYTFDHVYGVDSNTKDLYESSVRSNIVANVAKGYNGTVFAYGQTGSGKSHTMLGDGMQMRNEGIVTLAIRELFSLLEKDQQKNPSMTVDTSVSMLEIYNEQLRDLLGEQGGPAAPLSIRENEHGVYVHNAQRRRVQNARECLSLIHTQAEARVSAATAMNERSSRSHCVIRILVEKVFVFEKDDSGDSSDDDSDSELIGSDNDGDMKKRILSTLNLVDLAGSERVAKTGATGQRMVEGGHINKSLTILTTVINRLTEPGMNNFIPYRDSRLTHLLKTALGGNSFTSVFCCMTPAVQHTDESRSTLQFAQRAKKIRNNVMMNEVADPKTKIRELEIELKKMKKLNVASTIYLWSKDVKIKNLTETLYSAGKDSRGGGGSPSRGAESAGAAGESEQLRMIIEQLTMENENLTSELAEARKLLQLAAASGAVRSATIHADPSIGVADDDEKRQLRIDLRDMEQMVNEITEEKNAMQQSLDELDDFCKELEEENATHSATIKELQSKNKSLELRRETAQNNDQGMQTQIDLLQQQLSKTEKKLLEKAHGDGYLEELTKLHVEHQKLEFDYNKLIDLQSREAIEKTAQINELSERVGDLEDEKEEIRDQSKLQNSLLWRLLSVASLASHGKPIDPDETKETVRESQVEAAVRGLTAFVSTRMNRPPGAMQLENITNADAASGAKNRKGKSADSATTMSQQNTDNGGGAVSEDVVELQNKIKKLEDQIVVRDAQRDIIIDTKLKRIQELVLKLHTVNEAVVKEMTICYEQNDKLFEFIHKNSKLEHKLSSANLFPLSLQSALDRARFAAVPQKPYGHN